ncbi:hypothetical protein DYB32_006210 [Aphanomyces invadans]|uniref:Cyclic nucleotide-binding domain-containing protein n=1 Tax=Aphanomyces invadans TaxID=157072 RepID=A0A3R6V8X8_9STRA|nr:hypothetical protein DYB32_006210 [Aphanomyces invadans]
MGILISCASIACVLKLMEHADRNQMALQERLDDVCGYLEWRHASDDLVDRALTSVRASFVPQIETTRAELATQLPYALRARLQIEHEEVLVHTVPRFHTASKTLRAAISEHVIYVSKAPGDIVVVASQPLGGLYLLRRGDATYVDGGAVVKALDIHEYFGEDALFSEDHVAQYTVVCTSGCEFVYLAREHFQDMWQLEQDRHPDTARDEDGHDDDSGGGHILAKHTATTMDSSAATAGSTSRRRRCRVTSADWLPNSMFRRVWTLVCFGGLLYNIYAVPRDCAFFRSHNRFEAPDAEALVDLGLFWGFDVLFLVDFFLHCRRFYVEHDGHVVTDRRRVFRRYIRSVWCWIDLTSILPLDVVCVCGWHSMRDLAFFRVNKIVRILHLTEYFEVAEALLLSRLHVHVFTRRIFRIMSILVLSGYVVGCFWYYVAEITATDYPGANWVDLDQSNPQFYFQSYAHNRFYLVRSMYFGYIGGSTLGFGDIVPVNPYETMIATVMLLYGAILKPALVGGVASLLLTRNKAQVTHQKMLVGFKWLVASHKLPERLQDRVLGYFEFMWEHEYYEKEAAILEYVPELRWEIVQTMCRNTDPSAYFFRHVNEDGMRAVYAAMEPQLCIPHDAIDVPRGSLGILVSGLVVVHGCIHSTSNNGNAIERGIQAEAVAEFVVEIDSVESLDRRTFGLASFLEFGAENDGATATKVPAMPSLTYRAGSEFCEVLWLRAKDVAAILGTQMSTWKSLRRDMQVHLDATMHHYAMNELEKDGRDGVQRTVVDLMTTAMVKLGDIAMKSTLSHLTRSAAPSSSAHVVPLPPSDHVSTTDATFSDTPSPALSPRSRKLKTCKGKLAKWTPTSKASLEKDALVHSRFHPKSRFRRVLNVLVVLALLYNAFLVPFRLAFFSSLQPASYLYGFVVDYVLDGLFLVDIAVKYRYHLLRLRQDTSVLSISFHWAVWHSLKWDIVCGFPVELFVIEFVRRHPDQLVAVLTVCRLPKVFRLRYFTIRIRELAQSAIRNKPQWSDVVVVCRYFLFILFFSHLLACGWHYVAFADKGIFPWSTDCSTRDNANVAGDSDAVTAEATCLFAGTWIEYQIHGMYLPKDGGTIWERYSRCFNYAIQMLLVVSSGIIVPVNMVETIVCIGAIFAGIFFSAGKIGVIGEIILKVDAASTSIRQATDALAKYMAFHKVPQPMTDKALGFMEFLYRKRRKLLFQEDEIVGMLPRQLRDAIVDHIKHTRLMQSDLFAHLPSDVVAAVAKHLKSRSVAPGDELVGELRYNRCMYFVKPGSVQYQDPTIPTKHSKRLGVFGARSLLLDEPHPHTICACVFTEVFVLRETGMDAVFDAFPELKQQLLDRLDDATNGHGDVAVDEAPLTVDIKSDESATVELQHRHAARRTSDSHDERMDESAVARTWIEPDSRFRRMWDGILFWTTLYILIVLPLRATYLVEDRVDSLHELVVWYGGDVLAQVLYALDTYWSYNWFAFMDHSKLIRHRAKIRENYRSYLVLDLVSIAPYCLGSFVVGLPALKFLVMPLLLRAKRFPRYLRRFSRNFQFFLCRVSGSMLHILHCILYYVIMVHWWACVWMLLHRYVEKHSALTWAVRDPYMGGGKLSVWDEATGEHNICTSMIDCYVRAYYFVITFIGTVGLGDIRTGGHLEYFFENVEALCGSFFFAALTSCFASYFQFADTFGRGATQAKLSTLASYFRVAHTTKPTTRAIVANMKLWCHRTGGGLVEHAVAAYLPVPLRVEIATYVQRHLLTSSSALTSCDAYVRYRLVLALQFQVVIGGTAMYEAGDSLDEVAFVSSGSVKLVVVPSASGNDTVAVPPSALRHRVVVGESGCHVGRGEAGPCPHAISALEHVELYVLDAMGKREVLGHMPRENRQAFLEMLDGTSLHATAMADHPNGSPKRSPMAKPRTVDEDEDEMVVSEDDDDDAAWLAMPQSFFK